MVTYKSQLLIQIHILFDFPNQVSFAYYTITVLKHLLILHISAKEAKMNGGTHYLEVGEHLEKLISWKED